MHLTQTIHSGTDRISSPAMVIILLMMSALGVASASGPPSSTPQAPPCKPEDTRCEFYLDVSTVLTMVTPRHEITECRKGQLYFYNTNTTADVDQVITADGYGEPRMVYVVNGKMPGPDIVVYEGQDVEVHVTNHLEAELLTMHWHGLHQYGTPAMDGVDGLTQCPILPRNTFTYKFKAEPAGTHWYHSHTEFQITMGVQGAFIVKRHEEVYKSDKEFSMFIMDWNHLDTTREQYVKYGHGNFLNGKNVLSPPGVDGQRYGHFSVHSGLINGKGQYVDPKTGKSNGAPLTRYTVAQHDCVRFRVVNSGAMYAFRFAVDSHTMDVISSDGADMESKTVAALIIYPGETYDVLVHANKEVKNYKIAAKTLLLESNFFAEAILHYEGAETTYDVPDGDILACTDSNPCDFFNCPMPDVTRYQKNSRCIGIDEARVIGKEADTYDIPLDANVRELFFNFALPRQPRGGPHPSVNGRRFVPPLTPPLLTGQIENPCKDSTELQTCTYVEDLVEGEIIQMVLVNAGSGAGTGHSIHIHGHYFQVLKMGNGVFNGTTGQLISDNEDLDCQLSATNQYCASVKWSDPSKIQQEILGFKGKPMLKDAIVIPPGGYALLRFRADNPGLWLMHCHQELHLPVGMAIAFREAKEKIRIPDSMPYMGTFGQFANQ